MLVRPTGMLLDGDESSPTDLAFGDFHTFLLALGILAASTVVGGDFCSKCEPLT